jgi:hypothetical protein
MYFYLILLIITLGQRFYYTWKALSWNPHKMDTILIDALGFIIYFWL